MQQDDDANTAAGSLLCDSQNKCPVKDLYQTEMFQRDLKQPFMLEIPPMCSAKQSEKIELLCCNHVLQKGGYLLWLHRVSSLLSVLCFCLFN